MATKKWLNIIVDGSSTLSPYWFEIVLEYLQKIIRTFFDISIEKGANNAQCELGLVMYNANSNLGLDVQHIHWIRDVNYFLNILSCLSFNGDNLNPHAMVEGLAEALVMFPRPSNIMTTQEYYAGERHCILIAARDPVPRRMLVSVPEIQGRFVGTQLHNVYADFYEVAEMFGQLAVSLSIISPMQHPIFGVIFNMGNNDSPLANTPISNIRNDQFTVLLSRNFKEAHHAFHEKTTLDPSTTAMGIPIDYANDHQAGQGASKGLDQEGGNNGVIGGRSENCSMSTAVGVGIADPRHAPPADNSLFPSSTGYSFNIQPHSSPSMLPYASSISGSHQYAPFQPIGFGPFGSPASGSTSWVPPVPITPQFNPSDFWPPSSLTDLQDYADAWEGSLVAKIHRNRTSLHIAKALQSVTSPLTLTNDWSSRLEIALYVSQKALNHTIKFCCGPINYVFFHILEFNNLDLHAHLKNKNLCAKIHLPFQILILSPTTSKYHYIGTVFPGDTIFVEPV